MSSKRFSPTAKLLRNSRLFSLPPTLQRPSEAVGNLAAADTGSSTLPYPVQQAITTPASSRARGDWGLKRALPLRSTTKSSTPLIRINALDTIEHITDYDSAADLSLTLAKIQELALPITTRPQRQRASVFAESRSVFEAETDHTDPDAPQKDPNNRRWKFQGPWLAGMSEGDFIRYVAKQLRGRKAEFAAFLREHHARTSETMRRQENRDKGVDLETVIDATTEEQSFRDWMRQLRASFALESELSRLITRFLDLPESSLGIPSRTSFSDLAQQVSEKGPPRTHPSAGVSYLKSNAIIPNHPILGPRAATTPVEARVLRTRGTQARDPANRLGLAGIVTPDGLISRIRVSDEVDENIHPSLGAPRLDDDSLSISIPRYPTHNTANMGRVRTKTVKKSSKVIIERYYPKLTLDFETNKRICDEIAIIASKRLRNKIAGYTTHLMKRIQRGPVRGISFKLQEEERERKDQYVPEVSALDFAQNSESGQLDVDQETKDLLKSLGMGVRNWS
ncbi:hypothetical protein FH972_023798 [Carpinus fangiana]|uniref:Ribosomal protein S17e n=1 Tax=Carpinus fangiana TaxID=176857 RepID=A0A5N6KW90_9ROSI|nr:hypothetical protein FH972_023798 [Carpinus fangiana]